MERIGGEGTEMPTPIRKVVVVAGFIGTTIEWYDYFIFATASALFFPAVFFPGFGETTGTILAYATFAVGFGARPLGGLVFGHYGAKTGRKTMLVTTLLIMGSATFLVGTKSTVLIVLAAVIGLAVGHGAVYGTQGSFYAELFGTRVRYTRVRYSGASFTYQISGTFGGALALIIAAALFPIGGATLISVYIAVLCALSVLCYFLAEETFQKDIHEQEPEERRLVAEQHG